METLVHSERLLRFRAFEFNLKTHELLKHGHEIPIRGHPAEVLAALVESPGEVVTRVELRKRLWRETTYVDFEHILNNSVNKLREALGDDAATPHFIQTVPGLGYRFIAPVEEQIGNVHPEHAHANPPRRVRAPSSLEVRGRWLLIAAVCVIAAITAIVSLEMGLRLLR